MVPESTEFDWNRIDDKVKWKFAWKMQIDDNSKVSPDVW